jgi:hypothetical protein
MDWEAIMAETAFNSWALVELFGHQRIAGLVSEQQIAGAGFIRVDVPPVESVAGYTKLYYPSAIYGITPLGENEAKAAAAYLHEKPIQPFMIAAPKHDGGSGPDWTEELCDDDDDGPTYP